MVLPEMILKRNSLTFYCFDQIGMKMVWHWDTSLVTMLQPSYTFPVLFSVGYGETPPCCSQTNMQKDHT